MVREIIIDWSTQNSPGGMSVMYFSETTLVGDQREGLALMLIEWASALATVTTATVRPEGRELHSASGEVTGFWGDSTPRTVRGEGTLNPVSNVDQGLVRWLTNAVISGRRLRGRTFVPGLSDGLSVAGHLSAAGRGYLQEGADALISADVGFGVWHRPESGIGGGLYPAEVATVWEEFAVQRGRRE